MKITRKMVGMMAEARDGDLVLVGVLTWVGLGLSDDRLGEISCQGLLWPVFASEVLRVWHALREPAPAPVPEEA